jgi:hypothetical protein
VNRPLVPEVVGDTQDVNAIIRAAPSIARFAVSAWWRTTEWSLGVALNTANRVFSAVVSGQSPAVVLSTLGTELRTSVRQVLGISDQPSYPGVSVINRVLPVETPQPVVDRPLKEIGRELLLRSSDMSYDDELHPAYIRILADLAPDEGRILRLLAMEGAQPSVDVRTSRPLNVATTLVAPGLTMIGAQAGVRHIDRVPAYLNNLFRLGLIWFSREPVTDRHRYQVLEAQPDVAAAMKEAGRGRTIRRSIELTPFGEDFCTTCLPLS